MAEHEIVKRAFLNKTPAREDFFVFSVSNVIDVLPGEVIEAKVVQKLINDGVDVTVNLPMPPPGLPQVPGADLLPGEGGPKFRDAETPQQTGGCQSCKKKKEQQLKEQQLNESIVEEDSSVEVAPPAEASE